MPKFVRCASPHSWACSPVRGPAARSAAIRYAPPRKNANGETSMRPYRIGPSSGSRVCACSSRSSTGSLRPGAGSQLGVRRARQLAARRLAPCGTLGRREVRQRPRPRRPATRPLALVDAVGFVRSDCKLRLGVSRARALLLHRPPPFVSTAATARLVLGPASKPKETRLLQRDVGTLTAGSRRGRPQARAARARDRRVRRRADDARRASVRRWLPRRPVGQGRLGQSPLSRTRGTSSRRFSSTVRGCGSSSAS